MYVKDGSSDGITLEQREKLTPTQGATYSARQIQLARNLSRSLLRRCPALPVELNQSGRYIGFDAKSGNANRYNLLLAPAERAELIVDFRGFEGKRLILYSDTRRRSPAVISL